MDSKERAELIRQGNAAFNAKDYATAKELFTKTSYGDGLVRLGDHYMFERRLPLLAYGYYKKAGAQSKIDDIKRRMVGAIGVWIGQDKIKTPPLPTNGSPSAGVIAPPQSAANKMGADSGGGLIPVPVNPDLRALAQKLAGIT